MKKTYYYYIQNIDYIQNSFMKQTFFEKKILYKNFLCVKI